jgi:pimeloyl-ACP methyl ester carboxylesterase
MLDPQPPAGLEGISGLERLSLEASAAQVRQAQADRPLHSLPVVIISHSRSLPNPFGFPADWPNDALERAFQDSQDRLAELTPGTRHVIATKSGHYIQLDQPGLVTREIRSLVRSIRR